MKEHVLGYIFMVLGIVIMVFAVWQVYNLFTNKTKPYELFSPSVVAQTPKITREQLMEDPTIAVRMQSEMMAQLMQKEIGKSLNLGATLFFMYFVMTFGYRLSLIGVQLVRPIKVTLRGKSDENDADKKK